MHTITGIAGSEICEALGLENVVGLELRMRVDEITTVRVEYYPTAERMEQVNAALKWYKLVPLEDSNAD